MQAPLSSYSGIPSRARNNNRTPGIKLSIILVEKDFFNKHSFRKRKIMLYSRSIRFIQRSYQYVPLTCPLGRPYSILHHHRRHAGIVCTCSLCVLHTPFTCLWYYYCCCCYTWYLDTGLRFHGGRKIRTHDQRPMSCRRCHMLRSQSAGLLVKG